MQRSIAVNETNTLRPGATIDGDLVVGQLPDGDWLLVAPSHTFKRLEWGCLGRQVGACGTGREKTGKLVRAASPAAIYCRTALGKSHDLPSKEELDMLSMFHRQHTLRNAEIELEWAWSSTECGKDRAWVQRLSDGYQGVSNKREEYWVLPVRRVSPAQAAEAEAARLREQRDELLESIGELLVCMRLAGWEDDPIAIKARAAITKAKGES